MIRRIGNANEPLVVIEVVTDPIEIERHRMHRENAERNEAWLESHWPGLLPDALGKHLAVAGQEAFIAETSAEAYARARSAHPDDTGILVQYVRAGKGPRIYACQHPWSRCS
jgi:hypothetical protein